MVKLISTMGAPQKKIGTRTNDCIIVVAPPYVRLFIKALHRRDVGAENLRQRRIPSRAISCEEHSPSPSRKPMDEVDIVTAEGMTNDSRRCESLRPGCHLHRRALPRPAQHARIHDFSAILLTKP
jgi:hypothetical protein